MTKQDATPPEDNGRDKRKTITTATAKTITTEKATATATAIDRIRDGASANGANGHGPRAIYRLPWGVSMPPPNNFTASASASNTARQLCHLPHIISHILPAQTS